MIGRNVPRVRWPSWPGDLIEWAQRYAADLRTSEVEPAELLQLFAAARETAKTAAAIEEWLLLLCREHGVTLQDLAEIIAGHPSREHRRRYVSGPSDRELRLRRDYGTAANRLEALVRRCDAGQDGGNGR